MKPLHSIVASNTGLYFWGTTGRHSRAETFFRNLGQTFYDVLWCECTVCRDSGLKHYFTLQSYGSPLCSNCAKNACPPKEAATE